MVKESRGSDAVTAIRHRHRGRGSHPAGGGLRRRGTVGRDSLIVETSVIEIVHGR